MTFSSHRFYLYLKGRELCLALNDLRCTPSALPAPIPLPSEQTEATLSTLCCLHPLASCTRLGLRNPLTLHLSDQSTQLHWEGANHTLNLFPLLAGQLHVGSLHNTPQLPFYKVSLGVPTAALSHCPAFHTCHLSIKPRVSYLLHLTQVPTESLSLSLWHSPSWHLLLQLWMCCSLCVCSLHLPNLVYPSHSQPRSGDSLPWEWRELQSWDL